MASGAYIVFASEKTNGTQELLLTSPLTIWDIDDKLQHILRETRPELYAATLSLLDSIGRAPDWPAAYVGWELALEGVTTCLQYWPPLVPAVGVAGRIDVPDARRTWLAAMAKTRGSGLVAAPWL